MKNKFSKLLLLSSALLLASCGDEPVVNNDLQDAADYYYQTIKDDKTSLQSYDLNSKLFIGGVSYTLTWNLEVTSGDAGTVKIGEVNAEGRVPVTIDFDKAQASETTYKLTCTVTDAEGTTTSFTLERNVPKFTFVDYNKWIEACAAGSDEVISVKAFVIGAIGKESSGSFGSLYLQDAQGRGYYAYAPKLDSSIKTREALNAAYPAGTEVIVSGTATNYSGQHEFNKGCSVTATGNTAEGLGIELPYTNATEAFATAESSKDAAKLDVYQNARVTLENCKLGSVDGDYYYFTVGDGTAKYNVYRTNYFLDDETLTQALGKFTSGYTATITGVVSCYSSSYQIYPDSIDSITITSSEVSDDAKIDLGLEAVSKEYGVKYNKSQTVDLPETDEAGIAYTYTASGDGIALDENGNLVVTQSDVETTNTLTVTAKLGSTEKTIELTIVVTSAMPNFSTLAEAVSFADGTDVVVTGQVKEINTPYSEQYGNITLTITDGTNDFYLYRLKGNYEVGDNLLVTGTVGSYNGAKQLAAGGTAIKYNAEGLTSIPDALASEDGTEVKFFGMVNEINTEWSDQYGNITVTVEDAEGNEFYLYRLSTNVKVGDFAVFTGKVGSYKGEKQLAAGGTAQILGASEEGGEEGGETPAPETPVYTEMTLAEALAAEDGTNVTITGTVTSIKTPWSDQYGNITVFINDGTAELELFRIKTNVQVGDKIKVSGTMATWYENRQLAAGATAEILESAGGSEGGEEEAPVPEVEPIEVEGNVVNFSELGLENATDVVTVKLGDATLTFDLGANAYGNTPKYYTSGAAVRVYAYNTLTISSEKTIVAVKFTFVEGNVPTADDSIFSVGTYDYETFVLTVEGGTNEVMLTRNASKGHFKVVSVEVVYQG